MIISKSFRFSLYPWNTDFHIYTRTHTDIKGISKQSSKVSKRLAATRHESNVER